MLLLSSARWKGRTGIFAAGGLLVVLVVVLVPLWLSDESPLEVLRMPTVASLSALRTFFHQTLRHARKDECQKTTQAKLKILALGDSLTAGLYSCRVDNATLRLHFPYTNVIGDRLQQWGCCPFIANKGVDGRTAQQLIEALPSTLQDPSNSTRVYPYDLIFLLIGANDLFLGASPSLALSRVQEIVHQLEVALPNATLFLISLPACRGDDGFERYRVSCVAYQPLFQAWAKAFAWDSPKIQFVDLVAGVPYNNATAKMYFCDFIHFSKQGYIEMGNLLFEAVIAWLAAQPNLVSELHK